MTGAVVKILRPAVPAFLGWLVSGTARWFATDQMKDCRILVRPRTLTSVRLRPRSPRAPVVASGSRKGAPAEQVFTKVDHLASRVGLICCSPCKTTPPPLLPRLC